MTIATGGRASSIGLVDLFKVAEGLSYRKAFMPI
jgi:hypothetical protein